MIKALNTAQNGLLQAERRATDIARDILRSTSSSAASFSDTVDTPAQIQTPDTDATSNSQPTSQSSLSTPTFGSLIQQFADLRAEEQAFAANAKAFSTIDETLGSLLDDEG